MFISDALAQSTAMAPQGSGAAFLFQIVLFILILYFLIFRPNQKRFKAHQAMLLAIKPGDEVITGGGIYAKVISTNGDYELVVEIAPNTQIKINRMTVRDVVSPEETKPANSNKKSKK